MSGEGTGVSTHECEATHPIGRHSQPLKLDTDSFDKAYEIVSSVLDSRRNHGGGVTAVEPN